MKKKKNTLKDLDDFLRRKATSIVHPNRLEKNYQEEEEQTKPREDYAAKLHALCCDMADVQEASFREELYDGLLKFYQERKTLREEDRILIHTLIYLKHPDSWKEEVRAFWHNYPNI